ncbi:MAG: exodeoxyribonuclease V subunit alpha [Zoogloeaceae bacterium]|jgi:exodeoxyribonuclease V alpha subunit|nr:exodeoxyribonuclease V subunit alpha [Zoogloeaceae bacterium]
MNTQNANLLLARAFADQCRRWAQQLDAPEKSVDAAKKAGFALALAAAEGEIRVSLADTLAEESALHASGVAGNAASGRPLILDGAGHLYLARYFFAETRLVANLLARHRAVPPPPGKPARQMLARLFPAAQGAPDEQKRAAALALLRRLVVIRGGPGTGKTFTVARLLACLLADNPALRIALAAPTGKAAARMQEAMRLCARDLPPEIVRLLPPEAATLHRLLGLDVEGGKPRHHAGNPLALDVLVIDEASMLDLMLTHQLCAALPPHARLILLGDRAQLQAVEAGSIFAMLFTRTDLSADTRLALAELTGETEPITVEETQAVAPAPFQDAIILLTRSRRFSPESPLGRLARHLAAGEAQAALALLDQKHEGLNYLESSGGARSSAENDLLTAGYAAYWEALAKWRAGNDPGPLFQALEGFRILCVVREGERGVSGVNRAIGAALAAFGRQKSEKDRGQFLTSGQPILIQRNDAALRLFNGDIGIVLEHGKDNALFACFPAHDATGYHWLPLSRLPVWEGAFAMSVHKAQGSEFGHVALLLPEKDNPLMTRELLYTALTRARQSIALLGNRALLQDAIARGLRTEDRRQKSKRRFAPDGGCGLPRRYALENDGCSTFNRPPPIP